METPKITEIPQELEPVDHDTFIDDLGHIATADEVEVIEKINPPASR